MSASTTAEAILKNTTSTDQWQITVPLLISVAKILQKIVSDARFGFPATDHLGNRIAYRLFYDEGDRHLAEADTLGAVGFQDNHTLVVTTETRAGLT
jgi:hypothetical protein